MKQQDVLGWLAMGAAVIVAAHGEWSLAVACGFGGIVAAALPVAIDAYALRAMQTGREVLPSVLLMIATNAASHLHHGGLIPVSPLLVVAVSAIAPVVLWRVHALRHGAKVAAPEPAAVPQGNTPVITEVFTPSPPPAAAPRPEPVSPQVICGGHLQIPAVPPRERLGTEEAKAAIEQAWRDGLSLREAAQVATRSTTYVQKVYARLDEAAVPEGQTAIDVPAAA